MYDLFQYQIGSILVSANIQGCSIGAISLVKKLHWDIPSRKHWKSQRMSHSATRTLKMWQSLVCEEGDAVFHQFAASMQKAGGPGK